MAQAVSSNPTTTHTLTHTHKERVVLFVKSGNPSIHTPPPHTSLISEKESMLRL
jgi:hypothetical protein